MMMQRSIVHSSLDRLHVSARCLEILIEENDCRLRVFVIFIAVVF